MDVNLTKEDHRVAVSVTKNSTEEQLLGAVQRAETASDECAILYDLFDDRFLGAKESAPTLDNDGNALQVGAMYYNSVTLTTHIWNGSGWDTTSLSANDIKVSYESNPDTNALTDAEKISVGYVDTMKIQTDALALTGMSVLSGTNLTPQTIGLTATKVISFDALTVEVGTGTPGS